MGEYASLIARILHVGARRVSSTAKHFLALHAMVERNYSHALILEDDACITLDPDKYPSAPKCKSNFGPEEFRTILPQHLQYLPQDFDMLFVGTCSDDVYNSVISEHVHYKGVVAAFYSRCVSGMVVSLSGAKKLLSTLPMRHPFDTHINAIAKASLRKRGGTVKLKLFWTMPAMMAQTDEVRGHNTREYIQLLKCSPRIRALAVQGGSSNALKTPIKADGSDKI
jgi:GR25 family glycosyltransferase involved in LPS biosynthesis